MQPHHPELPKLAERAFEAVAADLPQGLPAIPRLDDKTTIWLAATVGRHYLVAHAEGHITCAQIQSTLEDWELDPERDQQKTIRKAMTITQAMRFDDLAPTLYEVANLLAVYLGREEVREATANSIAFQLLENGPDEGALSTHLASAAYSVAFKQIAATALTGLAPLTPGLGAHTDPDREQYNQLVRNARAAGQSTRTIAERLNIARATVQAIIADGK